MLPACRSSSPTPTRATCCRRPASMAAPARPRSGRSTSRAAGLLRRYNTLLDVSGNITKVMGAHNMKTGMFVEHTTRPAQRASAFNGTLSFNTDGSNPLNTNLGFANALLGAVTQYQESNGHPSAHGEFMNTEFYVQDNWRMRRELHGRCRRAVLLHHPDLEPGRQGAAVRARTIQSGPGAAALPAGGRQRRARGAATR